MSLFEDILHDNESLIKDIDVLDFNYMPKLILYRENEQNELAYAIKPLFNNMSGSNVLLYGTQGVGKTLSSKRVLDELDDYDEINKIYFNAWQYNTEYKIYSHINDYFGNISASNKVDEVQKLALESLNEKPVVIIIDEVDKLDDFNILYIFLEKIKVKSLIFLTNYETLVSRIDQRIISRLNLKRREFKPYTKDQVKGILNERIKYAFYDSSCIDKDALNKIVESVDLNGDIRRGLTLLKESAFLAESKSLRTITIDVVNDVIKDLISVKTNNINNESDLSDDQKQLLELIKEFKEIKIGDLYSHYTKKGGLKSYKYIQRTVDKLKKGRFVKTKKVHLSNGYTTIITV